MQILIPDSWLRKYLETNASPQDIQKSLSLCGPSIERIHSVGTDTVYDIEVTTNRVDCMSVLGIAREAAAILPQFGFQAKLLSDPLSKQPKLNLATKVAYLDLDLDTSLCPRFTAVLIENVSVGPSPLDISEKLTSVGLRPLNNIIDITNLLTHEFGQPLHVFDYDKIQNHKMILRASKPGEQVTTLDNKTHSLPGGDIIIEDGSGQLIDLCGIMGGLNSSVTENTKNVLLFVQTYEKYTIRKTSMALGHRTSAAQLFEKGLPTEPVLPVLHQAAKLIYKISGGKIALQVLDVLSVSEKEFVISLDTPLYSLASKLIGVPVNSSQVSDILKLLNFHMSSQTQVKVPYYRKFDITISEDLVEEIARLHGYHNLPPILMTGTIPIPKSNSTFYWENRIKTALKYFGFNEVYTYSLVSSDQGLQLKNPLTTDWQYLRTSLFPSHKQVVLQNQGKFPQINIFEIANVYLPQNAALPLEQLRLIITSSNPDYLLFKGQCQALLSDLGIKNLTPDINNYKNIIFWEIPLDQLLASATDNKSYTPISKFSPIYEDINVTLPEKHADLETKIKRVSSLITDIKIIDRYQNKLTLRLTFNSPEKQLSSDDLIQIRQKLSLI